MVDGPVGHLEPRLAQSFVGVLYAVKPMISAIGTGWARLSAPPDS